MASVCTIHCSMSSASKRSSLSARPSTNCWNAPKFAHLALQDDVAFDARHDAIDHAPGLRRCAARRALAGETAANNMSTRRWIVVRRIRTSSPD